MLTCLQSTGKLIFKYIAFFFSSVVSHVAQGGLELVGSGDPSASASQVTTGLQECTVHPAKAVLCLEPELPSDELGT